MTAFRMPRPATAFSLDRDRKSRGGRRNDRDHLAYIRQLPCLVCGSRRDVEAAHIRMADPAYAKGLTGMGTKPDDTWATPLCAACHRTGSDAQHAGSEREWWHAKGIDPLGVALKLRGVSGDQEAGEAIISMTRAAQKVVTR